MARLILPRKWTQQPTGPTYIDPGNPLTDGLIDALLPIGGLWQSVPWGLGRPKVTTAQDQTPFTNTNSPTPTWGQRGRALNYVRASSHSSSRTSAPLKQATECSALVAVVPGASVAAGNPFFAYGNSSSTNPLLMINWAASSNPEMRVRDLSGTDQTLAGTGGLFTASQAHIVVGTRSQVQNFQRIYCDGQLTGSAAATSMAATTFDRTGVCVLSRSTLALQQSGDVFLCLAWNRALQPDEVNALSVNPWQVFASPSAGFYYTGTVSGGTVSGTGSSAGVATVSGVGASKSAQVGTSSGVGAVSGIAASKSAQVGNSAGAATASGIGASVSSQVGNASGVATVTGITPSIVSGVGSAAGTSTAQAVSEDTNSARSKGGWDPYWYKPRAKNKKKREEVLRFLDETATIDAPDDIQETVEVAREAAQEYLALADTGHQREAQRQLAEALDRIDAFYEAARAEIARLRQQEEDDEDDWLLLN